MSIVLKLQSSLLIWKLIKWYPPPLSCHFYLGSFLCSLDLLLKRMKGAEAKSHPKISHACIANGSGWPRVHASDFKGLSWKYPRLFWNEAPVLFQKGAVPHSHNCSHHSTTAYTKVFFCKSHVLTWAEHCTRVSHPPLKTGNPAGNPALRRQVGRFRASGTGERRPRGPPQSLEGCASMFLYLDTVVLKK